MRVTKDDKRQKECRRPMAGSHLASAMRPPRSIDAFCGSKAQIGNAQQRYGPAAPCHRHRTVLKGLEDK